MCGAPIHSVYINKLLKNGFKVSRYASKQRPLKKVQSELTNSRLGIIDFYFTKPELRSSIREILKKMPDLERLFSKVSNDGAESYEVAAIKSGLHVIFRIANLFAQILDEKHLSEIYKCLGDYGDLMEILSAALMTNIEGKTKKQANLLNQVLT